MDDYKIIVEQEHSTVAAHYEVERKPAEGYQSEAKLADDAKRAVDEKNARVVSIDKHLE